MKNKIIKIMGFWYHQFVNWWSLKKIGSQPDFYVTLNGVTYLLNKRDNISIGNLKDEFKKKKDFLRSSRDSLRLLGKFKFCNTLKNCYVIYFTSEGHIKFLINTYSKGFVEESYHEAILHLNAKQILKGSFEIKFYVLERI